MYIHEFSSVKSLCSYLKETNFNLSAAGVRHSIPVGQQLFIDTHAQYSCILFEPNTNPSRLMVTGVRNTQSEKVCNAISTVWLYPVSRPVILHCPLRRKTLTNTI